MNWLNELWLKVVMWWAKRRIKKWADKLDANFKLNLEDLPDEPRELPLRDEDETDSFMRGF